MKDFSDIVDVICREDGRYEKGAYYFVRQALDYIFSEMESGSKPKVHKGPSRSRHISGAELLEGIRRFASEQYGPMAKTLFEQWGITKSEDFGDIVFNLVDYEVLGKTESDRKEDFVGVYDFRTAFVAPFEPTRKPPSRRPSSTKSTDNSEGDNGK